jgi:hypothetical protein
MPEEESAPLGPIEARLVRASESYLKLVAGGKTFADAVGTLVPGVGLIGMLLGQVLDRRVGNVWELARTMDSIVVQLGERIDGEFLQTADAGGFVEDILTAGARLSEERKRAYYASAFANGMVVGRPDTAARDRMIDVLERLRLPPLQLLAAARANDDFAEEGIVDLSYDNGFLQKLMPEERFDRLVLDWHELRRAGLVENEPIAGAPYAGYSSFITRFGIEFDLFVRTPYNDVHPPPTPHLDPRR